MGKRGFTVNSGLGALIIGKYADFTVLSQNIITIPEREILKTKVIYTIINGKIEYKNID